MSTKLFLLGRPGTGKTTASHLIKEYLDIHFPNWSSIRFNDYEYLYRMYSFERHDQQDNKSKQFRESEQNGFEVIDFSVLDTALKHLERSVRLNSSSSNTELIIIEFARQDYNRAFKQFSPSFIKGAYSVFLDADINTCIDRVNERVTDPPTPDNYHVSERIIRDYYGPQVRPSLNTNQSKDNGPQYRLKLIDSNGDLSDFQQAIEEHVSTILTFESSENQKKKHPIREQSKRMLARILSLFL